MDIVLVKENACWESVFKRINEKASNSNNNDHNNSNTSSSFSSSTSTLKHLLTEEDKTNIKEMFNALDPAKFWYLKATCDQAAKDNVNPESVEEKMKRFALECVYHHPCQSLILDLDDNHWNDVFSEDELIELHEYGKPVLRSLPQDLTTQLECIAQLVSG
ncbi:hypothetical protein G6F56_008467 [Rhizopus delemar]|uniref:Uncharacterized protein n=1 Tax=Rhizopus stolonifer TaxID=4846 RepID=A0A367IZJ1_RHIST|nr:hypothetical protein G6F56_008467 [Rhizopus delemar]RCH82999.1 hypothetical protein CU098_008316 [Rhizopus stolonifer]